MVAWYKHDIPAWMDGTEGLDDGAYRAYHVICQLIYLNEGPIAFNQHGIAGRCRQSVRTFQRSLKTLLDAGKLRLESGRITNLRSQKELENISERRINSSKGGVKSGESRKSPDKPLKNNEPDEVPLKQDLTEKRREEEKRQEHSPNLKKVRTKFEYSEQFEKQFWELYPLTPNMGKQEAWQEWSKLSPDDRLAAIAALPAFKTFLRSKPDLSVQHACRFLSKRRFEGFSSVLSPQFDVRKHLV